MSSMDSLWPRSPRPARLPRRLSADEQGRFLQAADRPTSALDRALLRVLFDTGLRLREVQRLNVGDVRQARELGTYFVRVPDRKTGCPTERMVSRRTAGVLGTWLGVRAARHADHPDAALFVDDDDARLSLDAIAGIVRRAASDAGLAMSAHALRATWQARRSAAMVVRRRGGDRNGASDDARARRARDASLLQWLHDEGPKDN